MGVYTRPDSPFLWMLLEQPKRRPLRRSTGILKDGGSPAGNKEMRRLAQEVYAKRMADLARLRFKLPTDLQARTFKEQRTWYAEHITPTKRGVAQEHSKLNGLGQYFDQMELVAIEQRTAREWRTWRLAKVKASTVYREEALLKHILSTAIPTYIDANPLEGLAGLRVTGTDTRILTLDEERHLLNACATKEDHALIVCALDTLLRLTNAKDLTRKQDHGTYLFSDTKTDAIRIPISTRLRKALNGLPMAGNAYFPTYAMRHKNVVGRMFAATCERANVKVGRATGGISFHCLRHTGASRMLASGVDIKTVMMIGGWKNLRVLERYLHPTDAVAQAAVNSIAGHVALTRSRKRANISMKRR
jgi:integrase